MKQKPDKRQVIEIIIETLIVIAVATFIGFYTYNKLTTEEVSVDIITEVEDNQSEKASDEASNVTVEAISEEETEEAEQVTTEESNVETSNSTEEITEIETNTVAE